MFDFTAFNKDQLTELLIKLFDKTTNPIYSPDDEKKVIGEPIYYRGIGLDTESTTIKHTVEIGKKKKKKKTIIDACFCYTYQLAIGTVEEVASGNYWYAIYRRYDQLIDFLTVLHKVISEKNKEREVNAKSWIWCANLSHEWSFLKYDVCRNFGIESCFAKTPRDVLKIDFGTFVFKEAIGLFGHSLSDIAKNWCKTQKLTGDVDFNLIRHCETKLTEKDKGYMINDALILTEMHNAVLRKYLQPNGGVIIPTTSSGFVRLKLKEAIRNDEDLTEFREHYNEDRKKPVKTNLSMLIRINKRLFVNETQWLLCRNFGYSGGLCGSNIDYVGKELTNVQCIDLTSDYPAQLLHKKYPSGKLTEISIDKWDEVRKDRSKPFFVVGVISEIESKSHHATMSKHKILNLKHDYYREKFGEPKDIIVYNGKIRKAKNIVVVLNDVDLRAYANIYKYKISPLKIWQFSQYRKIPKWLESCILDSYIKKALLKLQGLKDTIEYFDQKRDVNAYYGVLATRLSNMFDKYIDGLFEPTKEKTFKDIINETWLNPYIAFYCTSYAREILMHFIGKYPDLILQYDTDSLYYRIKGSDKLVEEINNYNAKIVEKNEKKFRKNPNKELLLSLGTWDFEAVYKRFMGLGAKKYIKQDDDGIHTVIAGLPKKAIPKEIAERKINKPFKHYNPLLKYIEDDNSTIVIEHLFANKFASVYDDTAQPYYIDVTDYNGDTAKQRCVSYHAITEIDFTLSLAMEYLKEILHIQN